jgi:hypothetical protein
MVLLGNGSSHANRHGLLPNVKVQKAANFSLLIEFSALLFKPPDGNHAPVPAEEILLAFHKRLEVR